MARITYRVLEDKGVWWIRRDKEPVADFRTKKGATMAATRLAQALHGEGRDVQLWVHHEDGTIERDRTFGHDLFPPRG